MSVVGKQYGIVLMKRVIAGTECAIGKKKYRFVDKCELWIGDKCEEVTI